MSRLGRKLPPPPLLAWGNVALLGLLSTALAYVLYFRLIADEGPQKALTVTFIVLVGVGLVFAWGFIVNIVVFAIFAGLVWVLYKIFR